MSNYKLPRPPGDYLIGKYSNGECLYLITKEAYNSWMQGSIVYHNVIKGTKGENPLTQYSLAPKHSYKAWSLDSLPDPYKSQLKTEAPDIYNQLWPTKSEPTPDEYFLLNYDNGYYYVAKRDIFDKGKTSNDTIPGAIWGSGPLNWKCSVGTIAYKNHTVKKFPQLSSDEKRKLKELNPKRYKEWEDFYVQKYPNFKRLEEQTNPTEFPKSLGDASVWRIYHQGRGYHPYIKVATAESGWCIGIRSRLVPYVKLFGMRENWKQWPQVEEHTKALIKLDNPWLYEQFEGWYNPQPQCSCGTCKDCLSRLPLPDPKDDYVFIGDRGWSLIQRSKLNQPNSIVFDTVHGWRQAYGQPQHPTEYKNMSRQAFASMSGSICKWLKIADKFEQYYKEQETLKKQPEPIGKVKYYDKPEEWSKAMGINPDNKLRGGRSDRLIMDEVSKEAYRSISPLDYYNLCMNDPWSPGQDENGQIINQPKYSPNLKQQNNEQAILCRKVKPIIGKQIIRGNPAQGNRSQLTSTARHPGYKPSVIYCKARTGNS